MQLDRVGELYGGPSLIYGSRDSYATYHRAVGIIDRTVDRMDKLIDQLDKVHLGALGQLIKSNDIYEYTKMAFKGLSKADRVLQGMAPMLQKGLDTLDKSRADVVQPGQPTGSYYKNDDGQAVSDESKAVMQPANSSDRFKIYSQKYR